MRTTDIWFWRRSFEITIVFRKYPTCRHTWIISHRSPWQSHFDWVTIWWESLFTLSPTIEHEAKSCSTIRCVIGTHTWLMLLKSIKDLLSHDYLNMPPVSRRLWHQHLCNMHNRSISRTTMLLCSTSPCPLLPLSSYRFQEELGLPHTRCPSIRHRVPLPFHYWQWCALQTMSSFHLCISIYLFRKFPWINPVT